MSRAHTDEALTIKYSLLVALNQCGSGSLATKLPTQSWEMP